MRMGRASQAFRDVANIALWPLKAAWQPIHATFLDPHVALERGWNYQHKPPKLSEKKRKELMETSALDVPRSSLRAVWGILSPYWTKSGWKEQMASAALLATSLLMTWYAVQVTVEFGQWSGLTTNTLVQMFSAQSGIRSDMITEVMANFPSISEALSDFPTLREIIEKFPDSSAMIGDTDIQAFMADNPEWREILSTNPSMEEIFSKFPALQERIETNPEFMNEVIAFRNALAERLASDPTVNGHVENIGRLVGSEYFSNWWEAISTLKQDAIQKAWEAKDFLNILTKFLGMSIISYKATQYLALRWRAWSTGYFTNKWMNNKAFHRLKNEFSNVDNPDQRIQDDPSIFTSGAVTIITALLGAGMTFAAFAGELWSMGSMNLSNFGGPNIDVPGAMFWLSCIYAAGLTAITAAVGWKLPGIDRAQQHMEANFRSNLKAAHEFADQIALNEGEEVQLDLVKKSFKPVVTNSIRDLDVNVRLIATDALFGNLTIAIPKLVGAATIKGGLMSMGGLQTLGYAFGRVTSSLTFIVNRFQQLSKMKATAQRIYMLDQALEAAHYIEAEKKHESDLATQEYMSGIGNTGPAVPTPGGA